MATTQEDPAASPRIRQAAIACFGREGFGVGLRAIAEAAGVSLGLIRHHFGSKDELRLACDDWVLAQLHAAQAEHRTAGGQGAELLQQLGRFDEYRPLIDYLVRSLREGGSFASSLTERMIADTLAELEAGVAAGTILQSVAPAARAKHLVLSGLGELVLSYDFARPPAERTAALLESGVPRLELYAQGLLADRGLLDAYLGALPTSRKNPA